VGSSVINSPPPPMSTSVGVETFTDTMAWELIALIQSTCFCGPPPSTRYGKEKERKREPHDRLSHPSHTRSDLVTQEMPSRPGLAPWAYLNSTILTLFIVSSRTPKSPVATWVMTWSS